MRNFMNFIHATARALVMRNNRKISLRHFLLVDLAVLQLNWLSYSYKLVKMKSVCVSRC